MIPYELLQDLNKLVCSSKNKKIEDLFIKLSNKSQGDFYSWIIKNNKNQKLISQLLVPETLNALCHLFQNSNEYNSNPHDVIMYDMIAPKGGKKKLGSIYLDIYGSISEFYDLPQYKAVFLPFSNFFRYFREKVETNFLYKDKIRSDLDSLIHSYNESVKHHHMSPHEFKEDKIKDRRGFQGIRKRREMLHTVYGFFLKHFTEEIFTSLSSDPIWDNLKVILQERELANYVKVLGALPYTPDLKKSSNVINKVVRDVLGDRTSIKKMGLEGYFNLVRRNLFSSLEIPTGVADYDESDVYDSSILDDKSYFDSGGLPSDLDVMEYQETETNPSSINKYNATDVRNSAYIWAVSILLSTLREHIIQLKNKDPYFGL